MWGLSFKKVPTPPKNFSKGKKDIFDAVSLSMKTDFKHCAPHPCVLPQPLLTLALSPHSYEYVRTPHFLPLAATKRQWHYVRTTQPRPNQLPPPANKKNLPPDDTVERDFSPYARS